MPESGATPEPKPEPTEPKPGSAAPQGEEPKQPKPGEGNEPKEPTKEPETAPKKEDRKSRSWKALEAEKSKFQAERDGLTNRVKELEAALAETQKARTAEYTPEEYEAAAKEFAEQGETELAEKARKQAALGREAQAKAKQATEQSRTEFLSKWNANLETLKAKHPELNTEGSPLGKEVQQLLQHPAFSLTPNGINDAVQIAQWKLSAGRTETAEKRVKELEAEVKKLREGIEIPPGGGFVRPSEKTLERMTDAERRDYIRRQAEEYDASTTY